MARKVWGIVLLIGAAATMAVALRGYLFPSQITVTAPKFEVDPWWPKPLPGGMDNGAAWQRVHRLP